MTRAILLLVLLALPFALPEVASGVTLPHVDVTKVPKLRAATYDGTWSGTIKCLYDPGLWPEDECDIGLIFDIRGDVFSARQTIRSKKGGESTYELHARFKFTRLASNAIAYSLDSGNDEDGTWVETWSFVMTLTDPEHMIVHWTRVVNNLDMPKNRGASKFSSVGMGVLIRNDSHPAEPTENKARESR